MSSITLSIDVAHPPRRSDVVESELQEAVSKVRNSSSLRVLKIIHGHGSTGKGGSSKDVVRNWIFRNRNRVRAVIDGEEFDLFDANTQAMRIEAGHFADIDLGKANPGITIVWIK
ncbi:MAG: hypothetical protein HY961_16920 [Ignavibacteriae bacterium]|nr:hypothetical protein [Ignavibacteriota bacterium]